MTIPKMSGSSGLSILQAYDSDSGNSVDEDHQNFSESVKRLSANGDNEVPSKRPRRMSHSDENNPVEKSQLPSSLSPCRSREKSFSGMKATNHSATDSLPLPSVPINILQMFPEEDGGKPKDDPSQHDGRIRSFPHIRGNWSSYVYIQCSEDATGIAALNKLIYEAGQSLPDEQPLHLINDKHLSLSRTLSLRHHWIEPFTTGLKNLISSCQSFDLCFDKFEVYTNDEKSRTFISMKVIGTKNLVDLLEKCDESLADFELEPYYKDPSFHISCAWILGDHSSWAKKNLIPVLNRKWVESIDDDPDLSFFPVSSVEFKTGNQLYRFYLRK